MPCNPTIVKGGIGRYRKTLPETDSASGGPIDTPVHVLDGEGGKEGSVGPLS